MTLKLNMTLRTDLYSKNKIFNYILKIKLFEFNVHLDGSEGCVIQPGFPY